MKNMIRNALASLIFIAACTAHGALPAMNVTVSDASGKAAFKGSTDAKGTFATANLKPGNYVVQFNATGGAMKGNQYAIVVSAGKMKVEAGGGLNITGQVSNQLAGAIKNGKKMVWIPKQLGSNMPGHWVEEGSA